MTQADNHARRRGAVAVGFNSDNKAWILDWLALASYDFEERPVPPGTIAPAALFEEVAAR